MRQVRAFGGEGPVTLNPSWPLAKGLVFAISNAERTLDGSSDLTSGVVMQSGRIHPASTPFGRGRNRTDQTSQYIFKWFSRVNVGLGDFTVAAYYQDATTQGTFQFLFSNGAATSTNQWRLMPHYNGGYVANAFSFFTYDGSITECDANNVVSTLPAWYIGVRRGTTHQLWRDTVLMNTVVGTVRDVSGSTTNAPQLGWDGGASCSQGYHGPALMWNRGLTPTEIKMLVLDRYGFLLRPNRRIISHRVAAPVVGTSVPAIKLGLSLMQLGGRV